ncbi:MAG TPA: hypothetical protein VIX14_09010 [Terriglobales bacterium]
MRRWLSIATFSLILLSLPVWAQRRGGGGGAHFASGGGSAGHFSGAVHSGNAGRSSGITLRIGNPFYHYRTYYGRSSYYPYYRYPYVAYYPYYGWYSDPLYDTSDQDSYARSYSPGPSRDDSGLQSDVQALSGKIDRLQADVEARNRPKEMEPATALVFRDKHVEEVRNYAISGGTLWVLNESAAKKIPLAQLDLDATVKMNDDRGVDFQVPGPTLHLMIVR